MLFEALYECELSGHDIRRHEIKRAVRIFEAFIHMLSRSGCSRSKILHRPDRCSHLVAYSLSSAVSRQSPSSARKLAMSSVPNDGKVLMARPIDASSVTARSDRLSSCRRMIGSLIERHLGRKLLGDLSLSAKQGLCEAFR